MKDLSNNTIERICKIFGYLDALQKKEIGFISSRELAQGLGTTEYTVRKDLSTLGVTGHTRRGYDVKLLKTQLGEKLHLTQKRKAGIVGLGRLGTALLDYEKFKVDGFEIVAGFDCSINKLERIRTQIDVFSVNDLKRVVAERHIELGIIAVPEAAAQNVADTLCAAGVKGILNFSPVKVTVPEGIVYLDMDFTNALRFIAARL
ncbi:MAG: redox-sensing transcriptional repressor Rex [Candidatus Omnitrophica bacterium]|nr:redox-sensing transcriptional repressor Rex [Candidatus Omnitrophota bacterium]